MNNEQFEQKLEMADEILARLMHNYVWHLETRKEIMQRDFARLKSLIAEAELLLNTEKEKQQ